MKYTCYNIISISATIYKESSKPFVARDFFLFLRTLISNRYFNNRHETGAKVLIFEHWNKSSTAS
jgi:hypothetical protein